MKIRKIKKAIKLLKCKTFRRYALKDLKLIRVLAKSNHKNKKYNIRILTNNFYRNGRFINNGFR